MKKNLIFNSYVSPPSLIEGETTVAVVLANKIQKLICMQEFLSSCHLLDYEQKYNHKRTYAKKHIFC